jgi:hypothetical protein
MKQGVWRVKALRLDYSVGNYAETASGSLGKEFASMSSFFKKLGRYPSGNAVLPTRVVPS